MPQSSKKQKGNSTATIRKALEDFRDYKIDISDFSLIVRSRAVFTLDPQGLYMRGINKFTGPLRPAVPVTWDHAQEAYQRWKKKGDPLKLLQDWAFVLVSNDDYSIRRSKGNVLVEWLNQLWANEEGPSKPS